jgi:hypothetical protein
MPATGEGETLAACEVSPEALTLPVAAVPEIETGEAEADPVAEAVETSAAPVTEDGVQLA